ncbi:hypothetical protein, partial [Pseudomonas sp. JUb52]|uniref:hypothetical protein n=1 Tax=Pseudomonas sp. JUb52 TaxID=2485127 RepID=UPI001C49952F
DLSTVAGNKISNPPWVKFQSAGWVNFPSAPTLQRLPMQQAARGYSGNLFIRFYAYTNVHIPLPMKLLISPETIEVLKQTLRPARRLGNPVTAVVIGARICRGTPFKPSRSSTRNASLLAQQP